MLDKKKVELMTRLAFYEQTEGKEDFKISEYYRRDYGGIYLCGRNVYAGENGRYYE